MRCLLTLLLICLFIVVAHAGESFVVPEGIQYKKASVEVNSQAKQALKELFSGKATEQDALLLLENKSLICGPGLWRGIKNEKTLTEFDKGKVVFQVPVLDNNGNTTHMDKHEGKLFQSPDEVLAFWKAFSKRTDFTGLKIRKLNPEELKILWAMIPFDINEPLFILESKKHKVLTVFTSQDRLKIMWIDDYQNITFEKKYPNKPFAGDSK